MAEIGYLPFILVLVSALLSSFLITNLYFKFYKSRIAGPKVYRAYSLLTVTITAIFISIQFLLPVSLGLLAALSIIRYRTPLKDSEEVGLLLLLIAVSMCCATFHLTYLVWVLLVAFVGLLIINKGHRFFSLDHGKKGFIIVNLNINDFHKYSSDIAKQLSENISGKVDSVLENIDDGVISYAFSELNETKLDHLKENIKKYSESINVSIFYNDPETFL